MTDEDRQDVFADPERLRDCLRKAREEGRPFVDVLRAEAGVEELDVLRHFAGRMGVPLKADLAAETASRGFVGRIPVAFARRFAVVGLEGDGASLMVATSSPLDLQVLDDVGKALKTPVEPVFAPRAEILSLLDRAYRLEVGGDGKVSEDLGSLDDLVRATAGAGVSEDLLQLARKPPLVRLVDRMLLQALELRASDVHLQPTPDCLQIRYRIDGVLHDMLELPVHVQQAVVSRIKVMGRMDIAERRLPQDGRATVTIGSNEVDLRISSLPTSHGEQVVVRLLDKSARLLTLDELGMPADAVRAFRELISFSHGIILVTGPTGSGKTTTLYAALQELNAREKHILTIEDPIEYRLEGISQTQVNYRKGLTFASGLRSVVRQDPDVIMVGEIRDLDTARMAIQSALTGHLVFSTLHTNDAVSAATRLLDLGIDPYLVASSVVGVMAQRLVRRICPGCRTEAPVDRELARRAGLGEPPATLWEGSGCHECLGTGYLDRVGIFELVRVDDELRRHIMERQRASAMKARLVESGLRTLRMDGLDKALSGVTTLDEVIRVTQRDEL